MTRKIKDPQLLGLIGRIVRGGAGSGRGLPIGNLPSQFLANVYLDPLDHFVKERLRVRGYLRYMDDFVLFGLSSEVLGARRDAVAGFLRESLSLELNPQSTWINRRAHGLSFLGRRIHPNLVRSRGENRRRSLRKLARRHRAWLRGDFSDRQWQDALTAATAYHRYYAGAGPLLYPEPADGHTREG